PCSTIQNGKDRAGSIPREPSIAGRPIDRLTVGYRAHDVWRVTHMAILHKAVGLNEPRDDSCPASLVAGADARAVIAVEVLVEQNEIAPVWVGLEFRGRAVDRALAGLVAQEDATQTPGNLLADLEQVHLPARPGRALDRELVAVVAVEFQQPANDQRVDGHPD